MDKQLIVSSDSHIIEPEDLFERALGQRYGDATPRYVEEHLGQRGKHYFTGYEYIRVDEIVEGDDATEESRRLQQELLEASLDPAVRIRCLDKDGVWAEIVKLDLDALLDAGQGRRSRARLLRGLQRLRRGVLLARAQAAVRHRDDPHGGCRLGVPGARARRQARPQERPHQLRHAPRMALLPRSRLRPVLGAGRGRWMCRSRCTSSPAMCATPSPCSARSAATPPATA